MISKNIQYFGKQCVLSCDAQCHKAWGCNSRPSEQLSENIDDYVYLADHELGFAPKDPGTTEGDYGKPQNPDERLNKWCARECERSIIVGHGFRTNRPYNFDERVYNIPRK